MATFILQVRISDGDIELVVKKFSPKMMRKVAKALANAENVADVFAKKTEVYVKQFCSRDFSLKLSQRGQKSALKPHDHPPLGQ